MERRDVTDGGFNPNPSAMTFGSLLTDCQANPGAGVFLPLKDHKKAVKVFRVNANAIIADGEQPLISLQKHPRSARFRALPGH